MSLTEIKVRYAGNHCAKCNREMKVGWKAMFEKVNNKPVMYCLPCSKQKEKIDDIQLESAEVEVEKEEIKSLFDELREIKNLLGRLINTYAIIEQYIEAVKTKEIKTKKK